MDKNIQKLRAVMDMQKDIILITNGKELEYINKAFFDFSVFKDFTEFKNLHSCICEIFVDMQDESFLKLTYPDGDWITQLKKSPQKEHFVAMKNSQGVKNFFKVHFKAFDEASQGYMVTLHNATSYKADLDVLHLISHMQGVYFLVTDIHGEILKISSSLLEIFQVDTKELREKNYTFLDFLNEEDKEAAIMHITQNDTTAYETILRYKDIYLPVMAQGSFGLIGGRPVYITFLIDLRAVKKLQKEAKERDFLLFQHSKMVQMGEMINMIAHQWRQPLNAISAASIQSVMKKELGVLNDDDFYQTQNFIQKQSQKMSKIIDTFMSYSKAKQAKECFLVHVLFDTILELIATQLYAHNINIEIERECSLEIYGQKDMLEQVILNLLMNARDAYDERADMQNKVIYIKVKDKKQIEIIDFAGGMSDGISQKLFTPYFTTKEQGKGTGIGLYISRRIMKEHFGGDLLYEKIDNGSKFVLQFKNIKAVKMEI
ncbi:sensor histidine kinase [Hydrogenimonas sp.]